MRKLFIEIEKKIKTKEDLIFYLEEIDLANELILKNVKENVSEKLKNKINESLFSVLVKMEERGIKLPEKETKKEKKKELLEKKKTLEKNLKLILDKEKQIEEKAKEMEKKEKLVKNTDQEKEIEKERWQVEDKRRSIEKEKWEQKENHQKIKNELQELESKKETAKKGKEIKDFKQQIFFLKLLRNHLTSLPQINLRIAFFPEEGTISKISQWLEKEIGKKIILDLNVDPRIAGGAIIEYKGKIIDFSLIKEIKKIDIKTF